MIYYVYIMASASRVLYTGVTNDIVRRAGQHKEGCIPGFSSRYKTGQLVYVEIFNNIRAAISREKEIKGWLRIKKLALIQSANPRWRDLSSTCDGLLRDNARRHSERSGVGEAKNLSEKTGQPPALKTREILRPAQRDSE